MGGRRDGPHRRPRPRRSAAHPVPASRRLTGRSPASAAAAAGGRAPVDPHRHPVGRLAAARDPVELLDEVADPGPELLGALPSEPACRMKDHSCRCSSAASDSDAATAKSFWSVGRSWPSTAIVTVRARTAVEPLLDGAHPAGAHHLEQPGAVQHPDVVCHGPLGPPGRRGELGDEAARSVRSPSTVVRNGWARARPARRGQRRAGRRGRTRAACRVATRPRGRALRHPGAGGPSWIRLVSDQSTFSIIGGEHGRGRPVPPRPGADPGDHALADACGRRTQRSHAGLLRRRHVRLDQGGLRRRQGQGLPGPRRPGPTRSSPGSSAELVYVGISLGVMSAQRLAQTPPRAPVAPSSSRRASRPRSSAGRGRPAFPSRSTGWSRTRSSGSRATSRPRATSSPRSTTAKLFVYPGDVHLFTDSSLPASDPAATALVVERVLGLLARV